MTIIDIKASVEKMLLEKFGSAEEAKPVKTWIELENNGFVREQDAAAIAETCSKKKLFVSFRAAGKPTLDCIKAGHPCKGHKIMDKSIKKSGDCWTYAAPINPILGERPEAVLTALQGYVGHPYIPLKADGTVDFDTPVRPPVKRYKPDGSVGRVVYHLDGVYVLPDSQPKAASVCEFAILDATSITPENLKSAYTGDYDMHDLICNGRRPLANTPDELSSMDYLNHAMIAKDKFRATKVDLLGKERFHKSPYALIRHGAQTAFFDYLTTDKGEAELKKRLEENLRAIGTEGYVSMLPYGDMVVKIDENIAMFDQNGKAYMLHGVGQIYRFYVKHNLLDQIPFYNFFDALHGFDEYKMDIERFAAYINALLSVNSGLIHHTSDYPWRG